MHMIRALPASAIVFATAFYSPKALGAIVLDEVMTPDEQKKTGVSTLNVQQKKELESWINQKFTLKNAPRQKPIMLSENIEGGSKLKFSDGSIYEVAPTDKSKAEFWITPFEVKITPSGDSQYPFKILNVVTQVTVKAKQVQPPTE